MLAGGEAAAIVVVEAVARLVPGVMGNAASTEEESFTEGLLEYPQYTRPAEFRRLARTRSSPVGSPRTCGPVEEGGGAGPDPAAPARSDRRAGWAFPAEEGALLGRMGLRCSSLS